MRRIVLGLVAAALALGVAFAALLARASESGFERAVLERLHAGTGLRLDASGAAVRLLPAPRLRLADVTVRSPDGAEIARARSLTATPRLGPLLFGRVELEAVALDGLVATVTDADLDAFAEAFRGRILAGVRPPALRVTDGELIWGRERIRGIDLGLAWPHGGALGLTAAGRFRGRTVEATATLDDPAAVALGRSGAVRARFEGGGLRLAYDGRTATDGASARIDGRIAARAESIRDVASWFGAPLPAVGPALSGATLSGAAAVSRAGLAVDQAEIAVDGANYVGAARFALSDAGRPEIEATLDARTLDVTPYLEGFAPAFGADGAWSGLRFDVQPFRAVDLDLRLSARSVRAGGLRLGPTAATITVADGALDVGVGEAQVYGGVVAGRARIRPDGRSNHVRLDLQARGVDLEDLLTAARGEAALSGALSVEASLAGSGGSMEEIVSSLSGEGAARLQDGVMGGFRAKALVLLGLGGRLEIRSIDGAMTMAGGVARLRELALVGPVARVDVSGEADLRTRRFDLGGRLAAGNGASAPVRIDGPFDSPRLRLDRRSLFGRGGDAGATEAAVAP
ncbi:AsmA family protein [Methylopila turkensis]|uniref:Cell envelope biogenesis protein AsmA n=1 Tax=Methylopila turkensis TaxID=1437816 RepID=A0A9W6N8R1_9HYPH|nr:AsmA family protein [Methylopila turkensis]GLK81641.1 cell envelope biogenesis protein AsmA [Methylopila turkensis]